MEYKQNLHTHSTFCDGKDTPVEMILTALEKGFHSIGFSAHSTTTSPFSMSAENAAVYLPAIRALKEAYKDRIDIFCGLEFDVFTGVLQEGYDYVIGSIHYIDTEVGLVGFDQSQEVVSNIIHTHFGGDGMAYAKQYYRQLAELPSFGKFDILGHFDIIAKHCENIQFFDMDSKEYRTWAVEAAEAIAGKIPFFEVNTGAISRGYRTTPYPDPFIIKELKRLGFGAVITSDCHDRNHLDCWREEAKELLKSCGFKEHYVLKPTGWTAQAL